MRLIRLRCATGLLTGPDAIAWRVTMSIDDVISMPSAEASRSAFSVRLLRLAGRPGQQAEAPRIIWPAPPPQSVYPQLDDTKSRPRDKLFCHPERLARSQPPETTKLCAALAGANRSFKIYERSF